MSPVSRSSSQRRDCEPSNSSEHTESTSSSSGGRELSEETLSDLIMSGQLQRFFKYRLDRAPVYLSVCASARHLGAPKPRPSHLGGEARAGQSSRASPQPGSHVFTGQLNAETPTRYPKCVRQCRDIYHITCKVLVLSPFSDVLGTRLRSLTRLFIFNR